VKRASPGPDKLIVAVANEGQSDQVRATATFNALPEVTPAPTESPTLPPLVGDDVRVLTADPPTSSLISSSQVSTFTFTIDYSLVSVEEASLSVGLGEFDDSADCTGSGHLPTSNETLINAGTGEVTVTVTWLGVAGGAGSLAPALSYWSSDGGTFLKGFDPDLNFCYRFEP
jgi:hypothetical protein